MKILRYIIILLLVICVLWFNPFTRLINEPNKPIKSKVVSDTIKNVVKPIETKNDDNSSDSKCFNKEKYIIKEKGYKYMLIRRIVDTTHFAELTIDNLLTNKLYYGKNVGDTIYFEYIKKERFFSIK